MLRRDRVEQAGHRRARRGPPGFADGLQRPGWITVSLPDPRQRGQAGSQRRGEVHLAARRDALGDMPQRIVELATLVGNLRQAHVGDARGRQRRPAGRRSEIERLLVGQDSGVQAALGALHLAEVLAAPGGDGGLAGRPPPGDGRRQHMLGVRELAAQPLGPGQLPAGDGFQQPLALTDLGQGPRRERGRAFVVAAEHGEVGTPERDRRGDIRQRAHGSAGRRLEGLIGHARSACQRALGRFQRDLGRFHIATVERHPRLGQ